MKKIIISIVALLFFAVLFTILDYNGKSFHISQIIQPVIFASVLIICIFSSAARKYMIAASFFMLSLMIITYLLQMLEVSNWIGSLGFGVLTITLFSYLPELIKKGYIEKY